MQPRVFLGRIYAETGKLDDAEATFKELKNAAPDDPEAYRALGLFYASSGQKEKAMSEFRSVLAKKPKDDGIKAKLVETLIDLNRLNEAESLNHEILIAKPGDVEGLLSKGRILLLQGRAAEAVAEIEKVTQADPKFARSFYLLGLGSARGGSSSSGEGFVFTCARVESRIDRRVHRSGGGERPHGSLRARNPARLQGLAVEPQPAVGL